MDIRRTIEEVFDIQLGKELQARDFFRRSFDVITQDRNEQERANQDKRPKWLVCSICGENVRILGGKSASEIRKAGKNFHFAHLHNSKDCPIKTTSKFSREDVNRMRYRGIAEGAPHIELKAKLYQGLNLNAMHKGQVSELQLERVIRSLDESEWRKPDINLVFKNQRVAVELQLSTTWLDVIVGRQEFYRQEGIFILWVFNEFDYKDNSRKLAFSDIIYTNNYNAFIFDEEARAATLERKDLVLKCYFQHHYAKEGKLFNKWEHELITLDQLTFDQRSLKVYYRDIALEKIIAEKAVSNYKSQQLKESKERRDERNRLRGVRARHESNHRDLKTSSALLGKEIKELESQLKVNRRNIDAVDSDLARTAEKAKEIVSRSGDYWWSLPAAVEIVKERFVEAHKQLTQEIKFLEDRLAQLQTKDQYYKRGRIKRINEREYHVLDRLKNWDYITSNANRIFAYSKNEGTSLFASPVLQPLNSHKIMQMRQSTQVEFVIDLSAEFAANTVELSSIEQQLLQKKTSKIQLEEDTLKTLEGSLLKFHTEAKGNHEKERIQIEAQVKEKQAYEQQLNKEADDVFYEIIELDYLDDYDEEDRNHY